MKLKLFLHQLTLVTIIFLITYILFKNFMTLTEIAIIMLSVAVYFARQFDKVLDKPEETVKEDEHANNIGI